MRIDRRAGVVAGLAAFAVAAAGLGAAGAAVVPPSQERSQEKEKVERWQWYESGKWISKEDAAKLPRRKAMPAMKRIAATEIAPGLEHSQYDNGVVEADVLKANLAEPTLSATYTYPGKVAAKSVMTDQGTKTGAVAAVNGDFFDIGDTQAPRGVGMNKGQLINGPASGWNEGVAFDDNGGRLAQIALAATVKMPDGSTLKPTNLNSPTVAENGIGLYTAAWGSVARSRTVDGASGLREVEVADGTVTAVRTSPGADPVPANAVVLLGRENGGASLASLKVGDKVEVTSKPSETADTAITGNIVLVRDGVIDVPDHPQHPRTGVGFSADGKTMWLVALDGRSSNSTGMTYREFAGFMKNLGSDDAVNLDGGGSTTMVAKMPGDTALSVQNVPSDGSQRQVPNGLGLISAAFPPECFQAKFDFTAYGSIQAGANGDLVKAAQCLLKSNGSPNVAASGQFDAATETAVKAFQTARGLPSTGVVDSHTWTALLSAGRRPTLQSGSTGQSVRRLQRSLTAALGKTLAIDGQFGANTTAAVKEYQTKAGIGSDGIVGANTWTALQSGK